jgi:hypothetical protein
MRKLLVIIMMLGVASCTNEDQQQGNVNRTKIYYSNANSITREFYAQEITIDGCQYLYISKSNGIVLTHKGYCSNTMHLIKNRL